LLLVGLVGGCYEEPVAITTYPPGETPPSSGQPAPSAPPTSGAATVDCVNGWRTPEVGTPEYDDALSILTDELGNDGQWHLDALRYFTDSSDVPRWYLRGALANDANFRGRFLIEARGEDAFVAAVAPYESSGFQSPDWTGFIGDGEPQTYLGLPGQWSGAPYDFVSGAGGTGEPGLPADVVGCMSDT
jgi:hypothetical protein